MKTITWTNDQMSDLFGVFECLGRIRDEAGLTAFEDFYGFARPDLCTDSMPCAAWGASLRAALDEGRIYRVVAPRAPDGSLRSGIRQYLGVSSSEDIYADGELDEARFEVLENDEDSDYYPWLKATYEFLLDAGGFTVK